MDHTFAKITDFYRADTDGDTENRQTTGGDLDLVDIEETQDIITERSLMKIREGVLGRVEHQPFRCTERSDTLGEGNDLVGWSTGVGIVHVGNKSGIGSTLEGLTDEGVYGNTPKETGDGTALPGTI